MTTATRPRTVRLVERVVQPGEVRVDEDLGIIRSVRILNAASKNGRTYSRSAMENAKALYEGKPVHLDHRMGSNGQRTLDARIGWLERVRGVVGGLAADFHFLKSHPAAALIVEAARRRPALFGFSHNAEGQTHQAPDGSMIVDEITEVHSVDLVADPATTRSLFESSRHGTEREAITMSTAKITTEEFVRVLREGDGTAAVAVTADDPVPDAAPREYSKPRTAVEVLDQIVTWAKSSLTPDKRIREIVDVLREFGVLDDADVGIAPADATTDTATETAEALCGGGGVLDALIERNLRRQRAGYRFTTSEFVNAIT